MKIVFMGTPDYAVKTLEAVVGAGHEVVAVFAQPDKPVGRKHILTAPPVTLLVAVNPLVVILLGTRYVEASSVSSSKYTLKVIEPPSSTTIPELIPEIVTVGGVVSVAAITLILINIVMRFI